MSLVYVSDVKTNIGFGSPIQKRADHLIMQNKKEITMKKNKINPFIVKNQEMSYSELSAKTGISVEAVRGRYRRLNLPAKVINSQNVDLPPETQIEKDIIVKRFKDSKRVTDRKYDTLLKKIDEIEKERDAVIQMRDRFQTYKINPNKHDISEAVAFLVASDWHIEETVKSNTVNGLNSYDLEIAKDRSEKFFQNGLRLIKIQQKDTDIDTIVLALLGDFISNGIHDELLETNSLQPIDAAIFAQNLIASGIEYLLRDKSIKKIILPCHSGNHGRITEKRRISTEGGNSLEYFMYCQLANHFKGDSRVEFLVSQGYLSYLDVYGYTIRFQHGHAVRYGGGVGGVTVPLNKAIAQWDKLQKADLDILGHFHQKFDGGKFIVNGSLIGYNAYALSIKASYEKPTQVFFLISKKHGKTVVAPIFM